MQPSGQLITDVLSHAFSGCDIYGANAKIPFAMQYSNGFDERYCDV
jgi:hypothetical protein